MPQTGILKQNGNLNVFVATVFDQEGQVANTFIFSAQYTRIEIEVEAVQLHMATLLGRTPNKKDSPSSVQIHEHEVLSKDALPKTANHVQFIHELQAAVATMRQAIVRRFGDDNGDHWGAMNTKFSEGESRLIDASRMIP
jgi:hypothetical protein